MICRMEFELFFSQIAIAALWERAWEEENALRFHEGWDRIGRELFENIVSKEVLICR